MKKIIAFFSILSLSSLSAATYVVTNTAASGLGSFNQAYTDAQLSAGPDQIDFNITVGSAPFVIPGGYTISETLIINGASQPGYVGTPLVEFSGGSGFLIAANNCEINGVAIVSATRGIEIAASSSTNKIHGCYIGIRADGITAAGNTGIGINVAPGSNGNIIGGINRNVISSNTNHGLLFNNSDNNYIFNNIIGLAANGITVRANSNTGLNFNDQCDNNRIGGTTADSMNVIGGNLNNGILMSANCRFNTIVGNYIGCGLNGTTDVGNAEHGISLGSSTDNTIGGISSGHRNVISGNGIHGIVVATSPRTVIKSNYIGVDASGSVAMGNNQGIILINSANTIIGGSQLTEGNVISANNIGINFERQGTSSDNTIVKGNYIGTDKDGLQTTLGNNAFGIILKADNCIIGGDSPEYGNIISNTKGNCGVLLTDGGNHIFRYNLIGLLKDSSNGGNNTEGIFIGVETLANPCNNNIIEYNAIAYNKTHGINIGDSYNATITNEVSNKIRFNRIFCNTQKGIFLSGSAADRGNNGKKKPNINAALSTEFNIVGLLPSGLLPGDTIDLYRMTDCASCDTASVQGPQGKYHLGFTVVQADGSWNYTSATSITDRIVATATDSSGNTSEFSMCYRPCKATAAIEQSATSVFLKDNNSQTIDLSGLATFSAQNPTPGKVFWMFNSPDTANAIDKTNAISVVLAGNGTGDLGSGVNTVYFISNQEGCLDTASVQITVLYIPNLITPNGDGKNDRWLISNTAGLYEVSIYNRWGDRVFKADDYTDNWSAESLSDGAYFYEILEKGEKAERYKGWVQVVR